MSRIDQALRRAAEESGGATTSDSSVPAPVAGEDIAVLAGELFPALIGEPSRGTPSAVAVTVATPRVESRSLRADSPVADRPAVSSLFDRIDRRLAEKVVLDRKMEPASREQYRRLAAVLHDAQANSGTRVIMLASAVAGEGKTLTATNLALTLSESYQLRVLLIDADLRKPALHNIFKVNTTGGLSEGLRPDGEANLVVRQITSRLSLLPGGRPNSDPMAGLTSDRMRKLIEEAKETFDWVIIDTPPIVLLPDANLLASMVDAAVLVVRAESTPHHLVKRAVDAIGHKRILGVVLNHTSQKEMPYGGHYHEYYSGDAADAG
jgi:capsular exopolysaccharide synthesis family protein